MPRGEQHDDPVDDDPVDDDPVDDDPMLRDGGPPHKGGGGGGWSLPSRRGAARRARPFDLSERSLAARRTPGRGRAPRGRTPGEGGGGGEEAGGDEGRPRDAMRDATAALMQCMQDIEDPCDGDEEKNGDGSPA
eukprot:gene5683-20967_t